MSGQATKNDGGKPRYDLIPPEALEEVARTFAIGADKYGDYNYRNGDGLKFRRVFRALIGHAISWFRGEQRDQEDGQHHLAAVICCAMMLMDMEKHCPQQDDRPNADRAS